MVHATCSREAQLLSLPPADWAQLVKVLLASPDRAVENGPVVEFEAAWAAETERHAAELSAGTVAGVLAVQVFCSLRGKLAK